MGDHLTTIRSGGNSARAYCPEHGWIGNTQPFSQHGLNAVGTEARAHDDIVHGVYRAEGAYEIALALTTKENCDE